jgi:phosphatidylserine/phosphatidylglycerophosphate/cardiolipin synthase-like enzyme
MEFAALASHVSAMPPPTGQKAEVQLVVGPGHGDFMREARDRAERRILVASHRLSQVAQAAVIVPLSKASVERGVRTDVYFAKPSGAATPETAKELAAVALKSGVHMHPLHSPRLHAKVLTWDEDHALITSQNWLSVDPTWNNPHQELGLYVNAPGVGAALMKGFDEMLAGSSKGDGNGQSGGPAKEKEGA